MRGGLDLPVWTGGFFEDGVTGGGVKYMEVTGCGHAGGGCGLGVRGCTGGESGLELGLSQGAWRGAIFKHQQSLSHSV